MKRSSQVMLAILSVALVTAAVKSSAFRADEKALVTLYLGSECPASAAYTSRINALAREFGPKGVKFVARFPQASDDPSKIADFQRAHRLEVPCTQDSTGAEAKRDDIKIVPTVIVRSTTGKLLYRGAIDDNKNTALARNSFLKSALTSILANKRVKLSETTPTGCVFSPGARPAPMKPASYSENVASILNERCVTCHRPGEIGPFSLIGYQNAKNWAPTIAAVTSAKKMPPWKAVAGVGDFAHDNRLTDDEINLLKEWAEKGAPRGDASKGPAAPTFKPGWALGDPDLVLQIPKPFKVSGDGQDEYWHFVLKPDIKEPVFIQAVDVRPGNSKIVHHVILWIDEKGAADKVLKEKGVNGAYLTFGSPGFMPDNSLGGWAPGMRPNRSPEDAGFLLKPGANVVLEVHYHKSGKEETDQTKVGLYLAKDPKKVKKNLEIAWLANPFIRIKPGLADQKFSQTIPIPVNVELYSLMPHMHLLGRKMSATLINPDKTEEKLIQVDDWDFNWQFSYDLRKPRMLKAGSKVRIDAVFDNSKENPNNPSDPPKEVRWGEQTTDEMMLMVAVISIPMRDMFRGSIGD